MNSQLSRSPDFIRGYLAAKAAHPRTRRNDGINTGTVVAHRNQFEDHDTNNALSRVLRTAKARHGAQGHGDHKCGCDSCKTHNRTVSQCGCGG